MSPRLWSHVLIKEYGYERVFDYDIPGLALTCVWDRYEGEFKLYYEGPELDNDFYEFGVNTRKPRPVAEFEVYFATNFGSDQFPERYTVYDLERTLGLRDRVCAILIMEQL